MEVFGNATALSSLKELLQKTPPPPAVLTGPSGTGKLTALRSAIEEALPAADVLYAEDGVSGIRDAVSFCRDMPSSGPYRAVVIDGLEAMSDQARDACLKMLEEPPGSSTVLLVTEDEAALPPALRSRITRRICWSELTDDEMRAFALSCCPSVDEVALRLSFGRPGLYSTVSSNPSLPSFAESLRRAIAGEDVFLSPAPEALAKLKEKDPLFRSALLLILERVPKTVPNAIRSRVAGSLRLASKIRSVPSLQVESHWLEAMSAARL